MDEIGGNTGTVSRIQEARLREPAPADRVRTLVREAEVRGAPMISSQALQRRLFEVYDAASAVPEALALVQRNLGLTLDRTWYSAAEIDALADQIDRLVMSGSIPEIDISELAIEAEGGSGEVGSTEAD